MARRGFPAFDLMHAADRVSRRKLVALLAGGAALPLTQTFSANAQPSERLRRVVILRPEVAGDVEGSRYSAALVEGLRSAGWIDGQNIRIEQRWAGGRTDAMRALAKELVALAPEVIVVSSSPVTAAVMKETQTIPLVFVQLTDPVGSGFVSSFPAPGGNITGFTSYEPAMASKWLELLKEISPRVTNVAILFNPQTAPYSPAMLSTIAAAARVIALQPIPKPIDDAGAIEKAIEAAARESDAGLLVLPDVTTTVHQALIIRLAAKHRLPAIYPWRHFVGAGGLMAYSVDLPDLWRRAASYVDRVLKGQRPADLPVQAPIKFGLVINLKAAKAQGLDVPLLMLARADEVIE